MNEKINSPHYIIKLAQEMRRKLTPCEEILWEKLKEKKLNGFKFRRQHPLNRYILDFYCHEKKLAIEVDDKIHQNKSDEDDFRDKYIESADIKTVRITNDEIFTDIDKVLLKNYVQSLKPTSGGFGGP